MEEPRRAMAVMAHPDDADFTCAGTLARWIQQGWRVTYVMCTRGDKGTNDPDITPHEIAATREVEARNAARALGVETCVFLDHSDGEVEVSLAFRRELAALLRHYRPRAVFTHDPWRHYQIHPDHRAVGFTTLDAIAACRDRLYFPEQLRDGLAPHRVKEAYLWAPQEPNFWSDISETIDLKIAALTQHVSQVAHITDLADRMRSRARSMAQGTDLELAEAFRRMEIS